MVSTELSILQKGYAKLDATIKERRNILSTRLQKGERLSEKDSDWLDNERNLVEEDELLEKLKLAGVSVQDIYDNVMAAFAAREAAGVDGSDDLDDPVEPEPLPSIKEVLDTVSIIKKFTLMQDDEISRKTEASLDKFSWQLRIHRDQNLKSMKLTDFFKPQAF